MSQTIDNNSNTELTPKEVMEALLAGKVLRDVIDKEITIYLNPKGQIINEHGWVCVELELSCWEIAPETITVNGIEIAKPHTTPPAIGTRYYIPDLYNPERYYYERIWDDSAHSRSDLVRGIVHLTKEDAETHAKALLSFTA